MAKDSVTYREKELVIYCGICCDYIKKKDLEIWSDDDRTHYLCPGCGADLLPVRRDDEQ